MEKSNIINLSLFNKNILIRKMLYYWLIYSIVFANVSVASLNIILPVTSYILHIYAL